MAESKVTTRRPAEPCQVETGVHLDLCYYVAADLERPDGSTLHGADVAGPFNTMDEAQEALPTVVLHEIAKSAPYIMRVERFR